MSGRVMVVGACGRMGEQVRHGVQQHPDLTLSAALEAPGHPRLGELLEEGVVLEDDPVAALQRADVAIDFTVPSATLENLEQAAEAGVAYVTGTTGFTPDQFAQIAACAERIPVVHAPNFSLSVNVLGHLAREAARLLGEGFDAELFEIHHAAKRDAPSGTALFLAESVAEGQGRPLSDRLVLERAGEIGARPEGSIGIQTLRGGDNPGEHTVYLVGQGERLELTHRSATRDHFAQGAVRCAAWLIGRPAGLHPIETIYGLSA
ncbi:MAG: 4-hydroxy-tetrahydrodipicolinate reductase [bacterium TMED88]|nr:4-hydroxy-tetrahydrodipicolinate reductase [Deltaproteobacteria bacterium]OUV28834.1 MAG: 4-hydroxy-tetrahydrodipicolinate reductase [bacterium TMED88]